MPSGLSGYATNPVVALRQATQAAQEARDLARISREPDLARSMAVFRAAVDKAPDIRTALRDPRVLAVLGTALGLPEAASQTGLATRVLLADTNDKRSLPYRLSDTRWLAMAKTLNLAKNGIDGLRDPKLQETLLNGLKNSRRMEQLDAQNAGLGNALAFIQKASQAKNSIDVLGDTILRRVVTGALNLPLEIAVQSVSAQARAVDTRFDIAKLQNPREVQKLAERYLMNLALNNTGFGPNGGNFRLGAFRINV